MRMNIDSINGVETSALVSGKADGKSADLLGADGLSFGAILEQETGTTKWDLRDALKEAIDELSLSSLLASKSRNSMGDMGEEGAKRIVSFLEEFGALDVIVEDFVENSDTRIWMSDSIRNDLKQEFKGQLEETISGMSFSVFTRFIIGKQAQSKLASLGLNYLEMTQEEPREVFDELTETMQAKLEAMRKTM